MYIFIKENSLCQYLYLLYELLLFNNVHLKTLLKDEMKTFFFSSFRFIANLEAGTEIFHTWLPTLPTSPPQWYIYYN